MTSRRKVAIAAASALVLAGGGTALAAAAGHGHPRKGATVQGGFAGHGFGRSGSLAGVAAYLGITVDALRADLQSGKTLAQVADATSGKSAAGLISVLAAAETSRLDKAVSAGKLTEAQETALLANFQIRITALVNGTKPTFSGPGKGFGFPGHGRHGGGRPGGTNA